jgi:hypothetical protein
LGAEQWANLEIRWPSGKTERIERVEANQLVVVREGSGIVDRRKFGKAPAG